MKTVEYLNKNAKLIKRGVLPKIKTLTDLQFFIEIYVVYKDYLSVSLVKKMKSLIGRKSCSLSVDITDELTKLFGELPEKIRLNLPDDFYHIRHNTLICSKSKTLAKQRIKLLKTIYSGGVRSCLGRRNGVSGCRNCCKTMTKKINKYSNCVTKCMNF